MHDAPLPWYVAGLLLGLVVPILHLLGRRSFGISANFRHLCAALPLPARARPSFLRYDWRAHDRWNLALALGIVLGGLLSVVVWGLPDAGAHVSEATHSSLAALGVREATGFLPSEVFHGPKGWALILGGSFLVGFGARYAGGCTSGHAITGLAHGQAPSLVAVIAFFAGGLLATHFLLPLLLR